MGYRPPKGVRPPQLEGKLTGRPRGSKNYEDAWEDVLWGWRHRNVERASPPNESARMWWSFARYYPHQVTEWLSGRGLDLNTGADGKLKA